MLIKSDARLDLKFQAIVWIFLEPKWALKRAQKSLEDEVFRDLGAPGPPEASRKPPGSHFGAFLDYFWNHFGAKNSTANLNIDSKSLPRVVALRTSGAHFQAPWPVWGAAHWRSGH